MGQAEAYDLVRRLFTYEALCEIGAAVLQGSRKNDRRNRGESKMIELFDRVHPFTAKWEGGIVDHPRDPGGVTAYGVCLKFLTDFARRHKEYCESINVRLPIGRQSVLRLTREQAKLILRYEFWFRSKVMELCPVAAAFAYDVCVNCGTGRGIRMIQEAHNMCDEPKIAADGIIGPKTIMALRQCGAEKLAHAIALRKRYYLGLNKNLQEAFLKGWLNRVNDQEAFIKREFAAELGAD